MDRENDLLSGALSGKIRFENVPIREPSPVNKYKIGDDEFEGKTVEIPLDTRKHQDLDAEEMKSLMEQFKQKSEELGGDVGPSPNYSLSAIENQRMINQFRKG